MRSIKVATISIALFILANSFVYYITQMNQEQRINMVLDKTLDKLETHYEILLHHQKKIADAAAKSTIENIDGFLDIYETLEESDDEEKALLREILYQTLQKKYEILKLKGVLQYHFVLPNNKSFLRMHKPNKFGDNLGSVRADFKYTNEIHKQTRGFTQGRTAHGFRNVYPITSRDGKHLGAMEVSFSSDSFQHNLTNISKIHTHFIVDRDIFNSATWERDDLVIKYLRSAENSDFMVTLTSLHTKKICIDSKREMFKPRKAEVDSRMSLGDKFSIYIDDGSNSSNVISFLPIKNLENKKTLAWLVSYEESEFIATTLHVNLFIRVFLFILFAFILYLVNKQFAIQMKVEDEHNFLVDVINSTGNIMFATDFKTVSFTNRRFREFFNISSEEEFNISTNNNLLSRFQKEDGFLNFRALNEGDSISNFIASTVEEDRVVSILDKSLHSKAYNISISKTHYKKDRPNDFLVTLTDITKMKDRETKVTTKAYVDALTGVYNRNKFDEILVTEINRDEEFRDNLSVAILDIDHFKLFNDNYGHLIGDEVLIMLASYINSHIRNTDTFARWGGEEFIILSPLTSSMHLQIICDDLRKGVERLYHPVAENITVSFGVTQFIEGDTPKSLFKRCDEALYVAKDSGRNMVVVK